MKEHKLKIKKVYLDRIISGEKTCEIRFNDRDYQKGETIQFMVKHDGVTAIRDFTYCRKEDRMYRLHPQRYEITHVLTYPEGLCDGYVALSIKSIPLS